MFVGVGARRVRDMFQALKDAAPAILFIDEIDAVGGQRAAGNFGAGNREADQTLNQLLTEMDGFDAHASIMVIGATNRPDALDPALLRPGRFDRIVSIGMPDVNARTKILEVHTKKRSMAEGIDLRTIAKGTPGFSGADLEGLVNEAAMLVAKDERTEMTMEDLDGARDKVLMGREKSLVMDDKEKEMTAYHEAGHAIVGHNVPEHDPIYKISIVPRGRSLGVTMYLPEGDRYSYSRTYKNSQLVSLMGGRAAEELKFGKNAVTTGASNDLERATVIARDMITKWGFSDTGLISYDDHDSDLISEDTRMKVDEQIRELLDKSYRKAIAILKKNKIKLKNVAEALIEKETIDQLEFIELIGIKDETLQ
jgi:cell division protease FtsH